MCIYCFKSQNTYKIRRSSSIKKEIKDSVEDRAHKMN